MKFQDNHLKAADLVEEVLCADIKGALHGLHDDDDDDYSVDDDDEYSVDDNDADVDDEDLHLLLDVPQLLLVLLSLGLIGRLKIGDCDILNFLLFVFLILFAFSFLEYLTSI